VDNTMPAPERWDPMTQVESVLPASDDIGPQQPVHHQWLHHGSQRPTCKGVPASNGQRGIVRVWQYNASIGCLTLEVQAQNVLMCK
jgi:hypothetical protein